MAKPLAAQEPRRHLAEVWVDMRKKSTQLFPVTLSDLLQDFGDGAWHIEGLNCNVTTAPQGAAPCGNRGTTNKMSRSRLFRIKTNARSNKDRQSLDTFGERSGLSAAYLRTEIRLPERSRVNRQKGQPTMTRFNAKYAVAFLFWAASAMRKQ
jgi:hypothetical protein